MKTKMTSHMNGLLVTADDFGLTKGVTDSILEVVDYGPVNCVSVLVNGRSVDYALVEYKKRQNRLKLAVHLNLTEGNPVSDPDDIPFLVNKSGSFRHSFVSLFFAYLFSLPKNRAVIADQVRTEMVAQIDAIGNDFEYVHLLVNGHQHIHMIPFVFKELIAIMNKRGVPYVRISNEPFFLTKPLGVYLGPNMLKHILLNYFSIRDRNIIGKANIMTNAYVVGIMNTGIMTIEAIKNGLKKLARMGCGSDRTSEIIFHPGILSPGDEDELADFPKSLVWSRSDQRVNEHRILMQTDGL